MIEVVQEGIATTETQKLDFNISHLDLIKNDSEDTAFQFSFDDRIYKTLRPGELIKDTPVNKQFLYVRTQIGTAPFRAWGVLQ